MLVVIGSSGRLNPPCFAAHLAEYFRSPEAATEVADLPDPGAEEEARHIQGYTPSGRKIPLNGGFSLEKPSNEGFSSPCLITKG